MLSIHRENWIQSLKNIGEWFDFSTLNKDHPLYSDQNRNILGKFKLETKNATVLAGVFLRVSNPDFFKKQKITKHT